MTLTVILLLIATLLELLIWTSLIWPVRKLAAALAIALLSIGSGLLVGVHFDVWTLLIGLMSAYRVLNLMRIIEGRTKADYLFHVAQTTSIWLIVLQLVWAAKAVFTARYNFGSGDWYWPLLVGEYALILILITSLRRHMRTTKPPYIETAIPDRDLPSLTVAIPARNETTELQACLTSLLASNYPKLEIIVLDDCSQERRTPEIIRGYAHDGVRFVAGKVPPDHWQAKNYALKQLSDEANGELLLFCGVDVRFAPDSLRYLVEVLLTKHKNMLSVLPINNVPTRQRFESMMTQPNRYAWELALPRRWLNRPPVLSTCWLIRRETLHDSGGFAAVAQAVIPERLFARFAVEHEDGYTFIASDQAIGITSVKAATDQRATAIRTRYPQLHRRPELVAVVALVEFVGLVMPYVALVIGIFTCNKVLGIGGLLAVGLASYFYALIIDATYRSPRLAASVAWRLPIAVLYDIWLLHYSMWRYEFREVIWKDRNVCIPLMAVVPHLPKL